MNSHRSTSPTPRSNFAKPLSDHGGGSHHHGKRLLTAQQKATLQKVKLDERDVDLLKEFMERYGGNLRVSVCLSSCLEGRGRRERHQDTGEAAVHERWGASGVLGGDEFTRQGVRHAFEKASTK